MNETVSTRTSHSRRAVALMGWGCLVITAFVLWNARQSGSIRAVTDEPVAFILAAFSAFVGVFAWMLYNPTGRSATDSWSSFFAANATLFPPPIIGFCLMPIDSPLRWWLALGLFLLCVVAVLSHVPDEFFGVPRGRSSYFTPMPAFDRVEGTVLDPNASWFTLEDLTKVVLDAPRPSLAPRSYLQRPENNRPAATVRAEVRQGSDVDDILGTNFDLGLLSDDFDFDDRPTPRAAVAERRTEPPLPPQPYRQSNVPADRPRHVATRTGGSVYSRVNPDSGRLRTDQKSRREAAASQTHTGYTPDRAVRHASTLQIQPPIGRASRASLSGFVAGDRSSRLAERRSSSSYRTPPVATVPSTPVEYESAERISRRQEETERQVREQRDREREEARVRAEAEARREADRRNREAQLRRETEQRESQRREEARQLAEAEAEAKAKADRDRRQREAQLLRETEERETRARQQSERESSRSDSASSSSKTNFTAAPLPVAFGTADTAKGFLEEEAPAPKQLFGQTIQRDSSSRPSPTDNATPDRSKRRSRYDDDEREAASPPTKVAESTVQTSSLKRQQQNFERTRDEDGSELVEGVMKIHFDKGQKRANVHIPFSPPLPGMPEVDCECVGGEDLRLKVPVRQSYGIRIEARRTNADEPLDAEIGFSAVYTDD